MALLRSLFIGIVAVSGFIVGIFLAGVLAALLVVVGIVLPPPIVAALAPVLGLVGAGWLAMKVI